MNCSTIIVSYNTFELTRDAVETALGAAEGLDHEVIVVDNASPDDSAERLRASFPEDAYPTVHVVHNEENVGFSRANNQGAAIAEGEVLFFLNPDTVVRGRAIRVLYDFLQDHPEAGAVGPRVRNDDGTDQPSTFPFVTAREIVRQHLPVGALLRGRDRREDPIPTETGPVDVVKGCALALRREVFEQAGGWDESYFMYAEEVELCYALSRMGYANYYVREAEIVHYGGASSMDQYAEQQIVHQRSVVQFLRRHHGTPLLVLYRVTGALGFGARAVIFPVLARLHPEAASQYRRRGDAAATLFRWFLLRSS